MAFVETDTELWNELSSIVEDEGLVLYDAFVGSCQTLSVYLCSRVLEREEASAEALLGVTSGNCSRVCKRLITFFVAEGSRFGIPENVEIEVSSPGVNRKLRLKEHFASAVGERVYVAALEDEFNKGEVKSVPSVTGSLCRVDESGIAVRDEITSDEFVFPFKRIKSARIDFKFDTLGR